MYIKFVEWLMNKEIYSVAGDRYPVPQKGDFISLSSRLYKVILVTHCYDKEGRYGAIIEIEAQPQSTAS
jgi:hypothetical protein